MGVRLRWLHGGWPGCSSSPLSSPTSPDLHPRPVAADVRYTVRCAYGERLPTRVAEATSGNAPPKFMRCWKGAPRRSNAGTRRGSSTDRPGRERAFRAEQPTLYDSLVLLPLGAWTYDKLARSMIHCGSVSIANPHDQPTVTIGSPSENSRCR